MHLVIFAVAKFSSVRKTHDKMFSEHFAEEKTKERAKHKDRASKRRAAEEFEKTRQKEKEVFLLKTLKDLTPQAMDDLPEVKDDVLAAIKFGVESLCVKLANIHVFATGEVRKAVEDYLEEMLDSEVNGL